MKILSAFKLHLVFFLFLFSCMNLEQSSWIRINQLGYLPQSKKVAVLGSKHNIQCTSFSLIDAVADTVVFKSDSPNFHSSFGPFAVTYRLDFSSVDRPGSYYVKTEFASSDTFQINFDVYNGTADFLLQYMRQQRCGFNPFLRDSCHTQDGYTIYGPMTDSTHIDVTGGWHDAGDQLLDFLAGQRRLGMGANHHYAIKLITCFGHRWSISSHVVWDSCSRT